MVSIGHDSSMLAQPWVVAPEGRLGPNPNPNPKALTLTLTLTQLIHKLATLMAI